MVCILQGLYDQLENLRIDSIISIGYVFFGLLQLLSVTVRQRPDKIKTFKTNIKAKYDVLIKQTTMNNRLKQPIITKVP
jgi:hypothetical protein